MDTEAILPEYRPRGLVRLIPCALAALLCGASLTLPAVAEVRWSGFLEDTDQLQPMDDPWISYAYLAPGFEEKIAATRTLVIDQPEIHIAADSPYRGVKPDDMKLLADTLRDFAAAALADTYQIAVTPGPDTLYLRMGLTNVHLKKKRRRLVGYTPVGFVTSTAKRLLLDEFTDKVLLTEVAVEFELIDTNTGERVVAMVSELGDGSRRRDFTDWEQLEAAMSVSAARLQCRFHNAGLAAAERRDCTAITSVGGE